jgi:putative restriction endonuclease
VNFYVGVTDKNWYEQLKSQVTDEVNFWNPGGSPFRALQENELFLFKLHYPDNHIVGGGFFVRFSLLPPFLAWQAFGEKNGTRTFEELNERIQKYRSRNSIVNNPQIGCTILTEPFWFNESDWLPAPEWSPSIVRGKTFSTDTVVGGRLYNQIQERIPRAIINSSVVSVEDPRYAESMTKHRLGQGAFRVVVTNAYQRRCAITGEKTLPVLEAAHIIPYSDKGPHIVTNGLLLKSDFHTLFDDGYITVTNDYHVEDSKRLRENYGNGKDYYKYHGQKLVVLPDQVQQTPDYKFLEWHIENVYLG